MRKGASQFKVSGGPVTRRKRRVSTRKLSVWQEPFRKRIFLQIMIRRDMKEEKFQEEFWGEIRKCAINMQLLKITRTRMWKSKILPLLPLGPGLRFYHGQRVRCALVVPKVFVVKVVSDTWTPPPLFLALCRVITRDKVSLEEYSKINSVTRILSRDFFIL